MKSDPTGRHSAIESALLEYHRYPGRYSLTGGEPALLFSATTEVLQLANGRSPDGAPDPAPVIGLRRAACFFVSTALLYPRADHYALLGLQRSADTTAIKERYRLLMRLIHPDFAGAVSGVQWPVDAATRVNKAHEVLLSPVQRGLYDQTLDAVESLQHPRTDSQPLGGLRNLPTHLDAENPRSRLKKLAVAFGGLGFAALIALILATGASQKENLVSLRPASNPQAAGTAAMQQPAVTQPESNFVNPLPEPGSAHRIEDNQAGAAEKPVIPFAPPEVLAPAVQHPIIPSPQPEAAGNTLKIAVAAPSVAPITPEPPVMAAKNQAPVARRAETVAVVSAPPTPPPIDASVPAPGLAPVPAQAPTLTSLQSRTPQQVMPAAPPPLPPATPPAATPPSAAKAGVGPTLEQAHPLLSRLLQHLESGGGERMLSMLDRDARGTPAAQALLLQYNSLVGAGPVKVSNVQFKAEPREDRLLVTGHVTMEIGERTAKTAGKDLAVQAEFAQRDGAVVMTRLSRAPEAAGDRAK